MVIYCMLEVTNIDVYYGLAHVLFGVSLEVGVNEAVGLFGPNGHGKSTILKTISGLVKPVKGSITFKGEKIDGLSPDEIVKRGIIYVPEGQHLFPQMTVKENLFLGAYNRNAWRKREANIKKVFEIFPELERKKNDYCLTLSGGERQMVAIARGLMACGNLLMLDEPTLGLSPKLTQMTLEKIREIKENEEIAIIITEENIANVAKIADRLYLVENGKISLSGSKDEILQNKYIISAYLGL